MKKKVVELSGVELDYWVGMAVNGTGAMPPWMLGWKISDCVNGVQFGKGKHYYAPSTNWSQGGPIIEQESIGIIRLTDGRWTAGRTYEAPWEPNSYDGRTALEAAMRCFVVSKFGEEVEI